MNFDNFLWSLINVYVITSLANWSDIMYPIWDTTSFYSSLYFVSLILIGSYFAVNLCLVRRCVYCAMTSFVCCDVL